MSSFRLIAEFPNVVVAVDPVPYIFFFVVHFLEFWFEHFFFDSASLFFSLLFFVAITLFGQFAKIFLSDWQVLLFFWKILFDGLTLVGLGFWLRHEKFFPYFAVFFLTKYGWFSFMLLSSIGKGFLALFNTVLVFATVYRTTNVSWNLSKKSSSSLLSGY